MAGVPPFVRITLRLNDSTDATLVPNGVAGPPRVRLGRLPREKSTTVISGVVSDGTIPARPSATVAIPAGPSSSITSRLGPPAEAIFALAAPRVGLLIRSIGVPSEFLSPIESEGAVAESEAFPILVFGAVGGPVAAIPNPVVTRRVRPGARCADPVSIVGIPLLAEVVLRAADVAA